MLVDMLVGLYRLADPGPVLERLGQKGVQIRRAMAREEETLVQWVGRVFSVGWASECRLAMTRIPPACFVAIQGEEILGFACFEAAHRGFFGPMGVAESNRGNGIGTALLLCCLASMAEMGYQYAIIGEVGPVSFYEKAVKATVIPGSTQRLRPIADRSSS